MFRAINNFARNAVPQLHIIRTLHTSRIPVQVTGCDHFEEVESLKKIRYVFAARLKNNYSDATRRHFEKILDECDDALEDYELSCTEVPCTCVNSDYHT